MYDITFDGLFSGFAPFVLIPVAGLWAAFAAIVGVFVAVFVGIFGRPLEGCVVGLSIAFGGLVGAMAPVVVAIMVLVMPRADADGVAVVGGLASLAIGLFITLVVSAIGGLVAIFTMSERKREPVERRWTTQDSLRYSRVRSARPFDGHLSYARTF